MAMKRIVDEHQRAHQRTPEGDPAHDGPVLVASSAPGSPPASEVARRQRLGVFLDAGIRTAPRTPRDHDHAARPHWTKNSCHSSPSGWRGRCRRASTTTATGLIRPARASVFDAVQHRDGLGSCRAATVNTRIGERHAEGDDDAMMCDGTHDVVCGVAIMPALQKRGA